MPNLTILHTNDLHGKLSREGAEIIRRERASPGDCLLLDSGDAIVSGNIYYRPGGEPALRLMSEIGYDAMGMGNREFHFLAAGLQSKVKLARFPVLCANIRGAEEFIRPSLIVEKGGCRVALFGLTVPMITKRMLASRLSPYWFENPIEAAREIVPSLRSQSDIIVALTHIGLKADEKLAADVPGIDLILGGHTHAVLHDPIRIGATSIAQAGSWARWLGKIALAGEPGSLCFTNALLPLQPSCKARRDTT